MKKISPLVRRIRRKMARRQRAANLEGQICAVCGFGYSPILHMHHIRPLKDEGTSLPHNLIFLCPTCHALVHKSIVLAVFTGTPGTRASEKHYYEYVAFRTWLYDNLPMHYADEILRLGRFRWERDP